MLAWALRWGFRSIGVILCATAWLAAAGLLSLGGEWYTDNFGVHSIDDLLFHSIVIYGGKIVGAITFALGGIFLLWAFWRP